MYYLQSFIMKNELYAAPSHRQEILPRPTSAELRGLPNRAASGLQK